MCGMEFAWLVRAWPRARQVKLFFDRLQNVLFLLCSTMLRASQMFCGKFEFSYYRSNLVQSPITREVLGRPWDTLGSVGSVEMMLEAFRYYPSFTPTFIQSLCAFGRAGHSYFENWCTASCVMWLWLVWLVWWVWMVWLVWGGRVDLVGWLLCCSGWFVGSSLGKPSRIVCLIYFQFRGTRVLLVFKASSQLLLIFGCGGTACGPVWCLRVSRGETEMILFLLEFLLARLCDYIENQNQCVLNHLSDVVVGTMF